MTIEQQIQARWKRERADKGSTWVGMHPADELVQELLDAIIYARVWRSCEPRVAAKLDIGRVESMCIAALTALQNTNVAYPLCQMPNEIGIDPNWIK